VLDFLDLLEAIVDASFVGQERVGDIEMALLFGANRRYSVQRTLIATVIGPAGAGFQSRDVSLPHSVGVLPQGEDRQLLDIETQADAEFTGCVMQDSERLSVFVSVRYEIVDSLVIVASRLAVGLPIAELARGLVVEGRNLLHGCAEAGTHVQQRRTEVAVIKRLIFI